MAIPRPGKKVRGSESGTPINALFDLLGRRWALGVIWNLKDGASTFRSLQEKCGGISPTILNSRVKDLRDAGILERTVDGYRLTERGKELQSYLAPIGKWSFEWAEVVFEFKKIDKQKK